MKEIFYPLIDSIHKNYFKIWKDKFNENFIVTKAYTEKLNV